MSRLNNRGQEAIEFVILSSLIAIAVLGTIFVFKDKISAFFNADKSSVNMSSQSSNREMNQNAPKYESSGTISSISNNNGTSTVIVNGISVENIPQNLPQVIQTSGSSGATNIITDSLNQLIKQLNDLYEKDPTNNDLKNLINKAKDLANSGYLVADTEEVTEYAARKLSGEETTPPEENQVCQTDSKLCGHSGDKKYQLSNNNNPYLNELSQNIDIFNNNLTEFNTLANTQTGEIKNIATIISTLGTQIGEISSNFQIQAGAIVGQTPSGNVLQTINSGIASKTTDLYSSLIQMNKNNLSNTSST